jgi:NADPH2:quinone reductase
MKSVLYTEKGKVSYDPKAMKEIPLVSSLKPGQVLIKVECAVINPSDIYMLQGNYNGTYEYPVTPGGEGSGTVIAYGGGIGAWTLVGKRVGFTRMAERGGKFSIGGSYAEYVVTNDYQCISLNSSASWEQGACSFVNPLTAIGLLSRCKQRSARAVIQTGAASQLGRMMIKLFRENGIPLINVVRREEQVEMLKKDYGADYVLNSEHPEFDKNLYELAKKLDCNVALECVAGELTGKIM